MSPQPTVAIIGGGVAGLTVAHELARTGQFQVTVYEQNAELGGKARSVRLPDNNVGEHAMRVFLASYSTLYTIMQEVPFEDKTTYDNLVYGQFSFRLRDDLYLLNAKYTTFREKIRDAIGISRFMRRAGVGRLEQLLFAYKLARLLWLTPSQIDDELAVVSFEDYMGGPSRTQAFRDVVLRVPEMLVAAKRYASAAVVARIFLEWYVGPFLKSKFRRLGFASLNGPTSERFIDPWVEELKAKRVVFRTNTRVTGIHESARLIENLLTGTGERIVADVYVLAVQHNILDALLSPHMKRLVPNLEDLLKLGKEWSNGVQYFLRRIPAKWEPSIGRITVAIDSEWSLVFLITTRDQLWSRVELPADVAGVLSVVLSNGRANGRKHHKPYIRCTEKELLDETLVQIGWEDQEAILRGYIGPDLRYVDHKTFVRDESQYRGYATAAIPRFVGAASLEHAGAASQEVLEATVADQVAVSDGQLYIRLPGPLSLEPQNATEIYNLFIAGEFTSTTFSTPTMEKSCESGMRCALAICRAQDVEYDESRISSAELPFGFLRTLKFRFMLMALGLVVLAGICYSAIRVLAWVM